MVKYLVLLILVVISFLEGYGYTQETEKRLRYKAPQFLYEEKCSKCYTIERVFAEPKTENEWRDCITQMMQKNRSWITEEEKKRIIDEIIGAKSDSIGFFPQKKKYADARLLFIDRCTKCHTLTRIFNENKTREAWKETIERMRDNAPELFFEDDIPILTEYLAERGKLMREDEAAKIMVEKCLICHESGRILLEHKSKKEWEKCVEDMRLRARRKLKKDWFTHDEFKLIVDLLVKTQGFKELEESVLKEKGR